MFQKKQKNFISKITLNHPAYKFFPQSNNKQFNSKLVKDSSNSQIQKSRGINNQNFENHKLSSKIKIIDYKNAQYFGEQQKNKPEGQGIFIDDQFNLFFCQNWKNKQMNGMTFIKLNNQTILYGTWNQGKIVGQHAITNNSYTMIFDFETINLITGIF